MKCSIYIVATYGIYWYCIKGDVTLMKKVNMGMLDESHVEKMSYAFAHLLLC